MTSQQPTQLEEELVSGLLLPAWTSLILAPDQEKLAQFQSFQNFVTDLPMVNTERVFNCLSKERQKIAGYGTSNKRKKRSKTSTTKPAKKKSKSSVECISRLNGEEEKLAITQAMEDANEKFRELEKFLDGDDLPSPILKST